MRNLPEAIDLLQDTMFGLVKRYFQDSLKYWHQLYMASSTNFSHVWKFIFTKPNFKQKFITVVIVGHCSILLRISSSKSNCIKKCSHQNEGNSDYNDGFGIGKNENSQLVSV